MKRRKFQLETRKQVEVDAHVVFIRSRVLFGARVVWYIHGVGFCIAYSVSRFFLRPQQRISKEKEIRVFDG